MVLLLYNTTNTAAVDTGLSWQEMPYKSDLYDPKLVLEGVKVFVSTLWELQEMRFAAILDDVVSMAITIVVASVSCFLATTTTTEHNIL
ncbi:hypothetical protein F8388_006995 [Cannabis sativa]|uniref:Uncharacterized protein n=1 Tax=Cannabis sativa TaxID=3483 RepID=A0A7J6F1C9_CANSA|nr:hypothetical protein F8388_006995 [Cannabis sativa]KAF4382325.1 hypothetical protein G4B88_011277 [Cannabis sativa]